LKFGYVPASGMMRSISEVGDEKARNAREREEAMQPETAIAAEGDIKATYNCRTSCKGTLTGRMACAANA